MYTRLFSLLFALSATTAFAQHVHTERCKAHEITERYLAEQGLPTDLVQALPRADQLEAPRGGTLTVPVVFHVVHNTTAENIPQSAITAVMNQLNQDYSASNSNLNSVRATFQSSVGNVGFEFCLAQVDPQGNATTGVTRTQTSVTWFNPDTQTNAMKTAAQGKSPWDPSRYLNIWVCDISSGATGGFVTLGYAYLPTGGMVGSNIDGLVIDYQYGMQLSSRTATHEIGHYFGLLHTWGQDPGSCSSDDGFTDTPNTNGPTYSCSNTTLQKCNTLTQYENFMDYSNCSAMFSNQQGNYMSGILTGARSGLLNNNACSGSTTSYCIPTSATGPADGDYVNSVQLGTISNTNSGGTTQPTYTNFSSGFSTSLLQGSTHTITIQGGSYSPDRYAAWIDYDQNNSFSTSEKLGEFTTNAAGQSQSFSFTVPANANVGNTRLRVRGVFVNSGEPSPLDPCFNYGYGETEDYGIVITAPSSSFCIPTSVNGTADGDYINGVSLGSINNTNSGGTSAPTYSNLTATWSTGLVRGSAQTISIQGGTYSPDRYAAWIDYNRDNVFSANEKLGEFTSSTAGQTQNINFTVPNSADPGPTRLRVRGVFVNTGEPSPLDPCYSYAYGETEDYSVVVQLNTGMDDPEELGVALYPNPALDIMTIERELEGPATAEIFDLQGRSVGMEVLNSKVASIPVGHLAAGQYVIRLTQQDRMRMLRFEVMGGMR